MSGSPVPDAVPRALDVTRAALAIALAGSVLVFDRRLGNVFQLPKALITVGCAVVIAAALGSHLLLRGRLEVPRSPAVPVVGALAIVLVLTTVTSTIPILSLAGAYSRPSGLVRELSLVVVLVGAAIAVDVRSARRLVWLFVLTSLLTAAYGAVQWVGVDPIGWTMWRDRPFATLGNPNFLAAFLGMCVPLALWAVLEARSTVAAIGAIWTAGLLVAVTVWTRSVQGPVVVAAGIAVLGTVWLYLRGGRARSIGVPASLGAALLGGTALLAGLLGSGPLAFLSQRPSFAIRRGYWDAALEMFATSPIVGLGLDTYVAYFQAHRSPEHTARFGGHNVADDPHNLWLANAADGGAILLLAWIGLFVVIAWLSIGALRTLDRERGLLLGALGAAWFGYHVQSLVSIDVTALAVSHALLTGAIIGLSASARWTLGGSGRAERNGPRIALVVVVVLVAAAAVAGLSVPYRADLAAREAERLRDDRPAAALTAADQAVARAPWEVVHRERQAQLLGQLGRRDEARAAWREVIVRNPRWMRAHTALARDARARGEDEVARHHFRAALALEPNWPVITRQVARFHLQQDEPAPAAELMERTVRWHPDDAAAWVLLGRARIELGQPDAAREALEQAVATGEGGAAERQARALLDDRVNG